MIGWLCFLALAVAAGLAVPVQLRLAARGSVQRVDQAPAAPCALVLGARLASPGIPSALLLDRLEVGLELLQSGKVPRLLLSGLGNGPLDEVTPMRDWLVSYGVDPKRLALDREGTRTIESLRRAQGVFGESRLLVVTNHFHLPRTLFLARRLGLDAVGVPATARRMTARGAARNALREWFAQHKAIWEASRFPRGGASSGSAGQRL